MALIYTRLLDLPELLGHRSVFLFGPRLPVPLFLRELWEGRILG